MNKIKIITRQNLVSLELESVAYREGNFDKEYGYGNHKREWIWCYWCGR